MLRLFFLAFYVIPGVLLTLAVLLWTFAIHWAFGLVASVLLIPTGLSFIGHYLDGVAIERKNREARQKSAAS